MRTDFAADGAGSLSRKVAGRAPGAPEARSMHPGHLLAFASTLGLLGGLATAPAAADPYGTSPTAAPASTAPASAPVPTITAAPGEDPAQTARAKTTFAAWQSGKLDRSLYTDKVASGLPDSLVAQLGKTLSDYGAVREFVFIGKMPAGDDVVYDYAIVAQRGKPIDMTLALARDGKIDGVYFKNLVGGNAPPPE